MRSASPSRERVEVGHRSSKDSDGTDRETDVAVGVLGLEEPRIQHRQLLHIHTVCPLRDVAGGP